MDIYINFCSDKNLTEHNLLLASVLKVDTVTFFIAINFDLLCLKTLLYIQKQMFLIENQ